MEQPSADLKAKYKILSEDKSEILCVPPGYANGLKALKKYSKIVVFSSLTIEESINEKIRYDANLWMDWDGLATI